MDNDAPLDFNEFLDLDQASTTQELPNDPFDDLGQFDIDLNDDCIPTFMKESVEVFVSSIRALLADTQSDSVTIR